MSDPPSPPLPVEFFVDMTPSEEAADFVEGLLIEGQMSVIYGQSNSGKSFWTLDLALHVAAGIPWQGREITQGPVIWLAMEGAYGIRNRVEAWKRRHDMQDANVPFAVIPVALNLLDPNADTGPLIDTIAYVAAHFEAPVKLTVADTLARAMAGGNENSPEDMGALVTNGTAIQQRTHSHVAWIHHAGKDDARGARGHSSLRAATDTEIEIIAEAGTHVVVVRKQRELECIGNFSFTLKIMEIATNRRSKPITSCIVEYEGAPETSAEPHKRFTPTQQRAMEVLTDLIAASGKSGFPKTPTGIPSVPEQWWREQFYERAMPGAEQKAKEKAFRRASDGLIATKIVGMSASRVWLVRGHRTTDQTPEED